MGKTKKKKDTKQTLVYTEKEEKFHVKNVKCKNSNQKRFLKCIDDKVITVCVGLAGCGKTYLASYKALKMLEKQQIEKIVLVKSVTTLPDEDIGYLPGSIKEKLDPFMISFFGNIDKIIGEDQRNRLLQEGKIQIQPLAYVRGINIDNAIVLLDECQNLTLSTFKSIITRIGENSKYIIMGDVEQIDKKNKSVSILSKLIELFQNSEQVGTIEFGEQDCVRNPIIPYLLDKLKEIE